MVRVKRRGMALAFVVAIIIALVAVISLAVDLGRVRVAKTELQRTTDAAARAGVGGIPYGVSAVQTRATSIASANKVDEQPLQLSLNEDIELGKWDDTAHTFTVLTGSARSTANSVRITGRRIQSRNNGVPLLFAALFGKTTTDVTTTSVAAIFFRGAYGIVGIDWVRVSGSSKTDSWNATTGTYSKSRANNKGSVASNGDITIQNAAATVKGDATPGPGHQVYNTSGTVTGSTDPAKSTLIYPAVDPGNAIVVNDNSRLPSSVMSGTSFSTSNGRISMPGGTYYFTNFNLGSSAVLDVTGPVTVYINGPVSVNGTVKSYQNLPVNFKVRMVSGSATLNSSASMYTDFYAPQSDVMVTSNSDLYGSIIARTLHLAGNGEVHYDESLPNPNTTPYSIVLVK